MADRSSERDRRVKQLLGNKNPGFDVLGQAQAEIQDAQSELQNHIALQSMQEQARLKETSTISQVAGGMMAMEGGNQLQAQVAQMNPGTQAMMGKFGVRPQQSQNTSRNASSQRVITKSGDTTNVRNENITNNKTEIRITQPSIPMQAPVIPMRGPATKEDSTAKFKTWLSEMFARQQNESDIMKKEYRKKEWNLGRTTNRLMKKIGEATSNLGNRLDPKNMSSTLGGQLKWLLLIFGATMIGKVWKPAMQFLANLEGGFKAVFGIPMNQDLRNNASGAISIIDQLKRAIGIDPNRDDKTLISGIGDVFMQGINKLIDKLKFWFEDRGAAMKEIEFPEMGNIDFGIMGSVMGGAMEGVVNTLKGIGQYIGDLMTVAFGGSKGKVKVEALKMQRQAQKTFTDTQGKNVSDGDSALATGNGRNYMRDSDFDMFGNLKGNASSTQAMSQSLISMFNDRSGVGHTAEITTGVSQLFRVADRQGQVVVDPELLRYLGLGQQDLITLQKNGNLSQKPYRIIAVKPTDAQQKEMGAYTGSKGFWSGGVIGTLAGAGYGVMKGAAIGGAVGSVVPLVGNTAGAVLGGLTGGVLGAMGGGALGSGLGAAGDSLVKSWTSKGLYPKLVPAESNEVSEDGSRGIDKKMWVLDSRGADMVKGKIAFAAGMRKDEDMDLTSKNFYDFIRKRGEAHARSNGVTLGRESMSTNNLQDYQAQYKAYEDKWNWKFESKDANSENMQKYGNYNTAMDSFGNVINSGRQMLSNGLSWASGQVRSFNIGDMQQKQRAAWLMKLAMKYGFTKEQAAGIAGNAMRESSMITETAYNPNDSGAGPGGGLVGWLGNSCKQVLRYARDLYECNVNPDNVADIKKVPFEIQADILMRQLTGELDYAEKGRGKRVGDKIKRTSTVEEATIAMDKYFEVSAEGIKGQYGLRTGFANGFYQMDISTVDLSSNPLGSPITSNDGDVMNGKSGSTPNYIKNWLWGGGNAPTTYSEKDKRTAESLQKRVSVPIRDLNGKEGVKVLTVNQRLVDNVISIFQEIFTKTEFKIDPNTTGAFCFRTINNGSGKSTNKLSNHAYGGAIDINWTLNPLHDEKTENTDRHLGTPEHPVVQIFYRHGWIWGGVWRNKDKMHFEYAGETSGGGNLGGQLGPIGNSIVDGVAGVLDTASNLVNPNTPGGEGSGNSLIQPLTAEQKVAQENLDTYTRLTNQVNVGSLLRAGAKVDEYGVYIEGMGGTNIYLKEGATGIGRKITYDDISFVGKIDKKTGKLEGVTEEEEFMAKNSISIEAASLFSTYKGKGSLSDRMTGKGGIIKFYLGKFKDIDSYSEFAKEALNGSIEFWICPSKDAARVSYIEIRPVFSSGIAVTKDTEESREWGKVGPGIYDRGRKWYNPWGNDLVTSDWSPASTIHRVRLTPEAEKEKQNLFRILSFGKIYEKDGKLYRSSDNTEINENDYEDAKKYGILTKQHYRIGSGHNTELFANYGMSGDISAALGEAINVTFEGEKFNSSGYFEDLGLSFKDREKFFKENKDKFVFKTNGDISGPGGVIWGKGTKDNFKLFETEEEFKNANEALGEGGIKKYNQENLTHFENVNVASKGLINMNVVGDFISKVSNDVDIYGKDKDIADRINKDRKKKARTTKTDGYGTIGGKRFRYFMFSDVEGNTNLFKIKKEDLLKFVEDYSGVKVAVESKDLKSIEATTFEDLQSKLINTASSLIVNSSNTYEVKKAKEKGNYDDLNKLIIDKKHELESRSDRDSSSGERHRRGTYSKLKQHLIKLGKLVDTIEITNSSDSVGPNEEVAIVTFVGGEKDKLTTGQGIYFNKHRDTISKSWIDGVNEEIQNNKRDISVEAGVKNFNGSGFQDSLNTLLDKVKSGELKGATVTDDGKIIVNGKTVGLWDTNGPKPTEKNGFKGARGITSEDLQNSDDLKKDIIETPIDFFNEENNKISYYQREFGAVYEKDGLWVYDKTRKFRTKINLKANLGSLKSKKDAFLPDSTQAWDIEEKKWVNIKDVGKYAYYNATTGDFKDTGFIGNNYSEGAEQLGSDILNRIANGIEGVNEGVNLGNAYNKITASNSDIQVTAAQMASRQRNNQGIEQAKLIAKSQKQVDLLEIIANKENLTPEQIASAVRDANTTYNNSLQAATLELMKENGVINIAGATSVKTVRAGNREFLVTLGATNKKMWTYEVDSNGDNRQVRMNGIKSWEQKGNQIFVTYTGGSTETWNITGTDTTINKTVTSDGSE